MTGNQIQRYDSSCKPTTSGPFRYEMTLEAHQPHFDVGGDLGTQDVIVLRYDYFGCPDTFERFYYSHEWGWIRWEAYSGSSLLRSATFNKLGGPPVLPGPSCTIAN